MPQHMHVDRLRIWQAAPVADVPSTFRRGHSRWNGLGWAVTVWCGFPMRRTMRCWRVARSRGPHGRRLTATCSGHAIAT